MLIYLFRQSLRQGISIVYRVRLLKADLFSFKDADSWIRAVIVGLPGAQDSNAARAAIADRYMQKCTSLWIVAPINRAVDDRTANSLLGESFKRQLRMDNNHLA